MSETGHLFMVESCKSCDGSVQLECEGTPRYLGYRTHNEYLCPHCKKLNHALTPGAIVSARASQPLNGAGGPSGPSI